MSVPEIHLTRVAMRPTPRTWVKHILLLLATLITATLAGVIEPFGPMPLPLPDPQTWGELAEVVANLPAYYAILIVSALTALTTDPEALRYGLSFSVSLLIILISHEMGHYIACRIYGVDATLPFFIPTPPLIGPAGTFGAFIKIMSPMPSRKAVFDIGVAGPIAGFVALLPIAIIGVVSLEPIPEGYVPPPDGLTFSDPLLMHAIGAIFGMDPANSFGNPFYFASWVGLLVTALNLIPSGQLDGGHAVYAVFGERVHFFTGRIAFVLMTALAILGFIYFNSPSGFLFAVILGIMTRIRHPEPNDQTPLDGKRKVIAFLTLVVFVLCFVPFAIRVGGE